MARWGCRILLCMLLGTFTFAARARAQQPSPSAALPALPADFPRLESDALLWLQDLIRINTTNPPGNELAAVKYVAGILEREGIPSEIYESAPGRGFLVARLASSAMPDPSRALLLMAHLDVVGVDKSKWTMDPFGGVIKDGYLYGRGAIDDKGMLAANLAVLVALKRSGKPLNRDVIFLAEGDAEAGGAAGIQFAVEKHWDKIAAGYAINEGGRVVAKDGKIQYVGVQAWEKVTANVDVIATGTAGHGSVPRADNAVAHLAAAIAKIGTFEAPVQFNSVTRAYFEGLAPTEDDETAKWMRALEIPERADHAARWISVASPAWNAMMRDTVVPTMLLAGTGPNVIPSEVRAVLDVSLLPGNLLDPLVGKLQELVSDPEVSLVVEPGAGETAPSSSVSSDLYDTIERVAGQEFPGAPVLPMMSTGPTDSAPLRMRNVQAYGLSAFPMTDADCGRMHGEDERIPLDAFRKGVEFLYAIVNTFVTSSSGLSHP